MKGWYYLMKTLLIIYGITIALGTLAVLITGLRMKLVIHSYNYKRKIVNDFKTRFIAKLVLILICLIPFYNALQLIMLFLPEEWLCGQLEKNGWYKED